MKADKRLKVREITGSVAISSERVLNILLQHLNMKMLSARKVLRLFTKIGSSYFFRDTTAISTECLSLHRHDDTMD